MLKERPGCKQKIVVGKTVSFSVLNIVGISLSTSAQQYLSFVLLGGGEACCSIPSCFSYSTSIFSRVLYFARYQRLPSTDPGSAQPACKDAVHSLLLPLLKLTSSQYGV